MNADGEELQTLSVVHVSKRQSGFEPDQKTSDVKPPSFVGKDARKKIILLGDSITQFSFSVPNGGWGAGIADWYGRTADVINRGFSGYNSRWILQMMPFLFPKDSSCSRDEIAIATLYLGSNDASAPGTSQHVPITEYKGNLESIIEYITELSPSTRYILITPAVVDSQVWPGRSSEATAQYADAVRQIGMERNIPVADLWKEPYDISLEDLSDGLHMGVGGNRKIFSAVSSLIRTHYPEVVPEDKAPNVPNMPLHFPHWSVLGDKDAGESKRIIESWTW
jgi:lysophospholipase L1-like esterase